MVIATIVMICVLLVAAYFWHEGKKPAVHRNVPQMDLERYVITLLHQGLDRGFMIIKVPGSVAGVQLSKHIEGNGVVNLQLDFPLAPWSERYYAILKKEMSDAGMPFNIVKTSEQVVKEFTQIRFGKDAAKATEIIRLILRNVFEVNDSPIQVHFENVSPKVGEKVGF